MWSEQHEDSVIRVEESQVLTEAPSRAGQLSDPRRAGVCGSKNREPLR